MVPRFTPKFDRSIVALCSTLQQIYCANHRIAFEKEPNAPLNALRTIGVEWSAIPGAAAAKMRRRNPKKPDWKISLTAKAGDGKSMRRQPTEVSWCCEYSNPFQVSGSVEMPSIPARRRLFNLQKAAPKGHC